MSELQVVEHPDAIKTVLVRWNGVKIDLTKLARLRWIEKMKSHELCQIFGLRRTAINRSIRTLRNSGVSQLNLEESEKNLIQSRINIETEKLIREQDQFNLKSADQRVRRRIS